MSYPFVHEPIVIELGVHTLILKGTQGLELFAKAGNGVDLNSEEMYRLYMSLHTQYQPPTAEPDEEIG